jgi:hypothetical protein
VIERESGFPTPTGSGLAEAIECATPAPALSVFGLPDGDRVALLPLTYQVAQMLHACTEVRPGRDNDRFRDLVDLLLLEELVAADDVPRLRFACEEVFALRDRTPWPPVVTVYAGWYEPYRVPSSSSQWWDPTGGPARGDGPEASPRMVLDDGDGPGTAARRASSP